MSTFDAEAGREAFERELDNDELAERFFSRPPEADPALEVWEPPAMSRGNRRAMVATFALIGCCAIGGLAFMVFGEHFRVAPATVGAKRSELGPAWNPPPSANPASDRSAASADPTTAQELARGSELAPAPAAHAPELGAAEPAEPVAREASTETPKLDAPEPAAPAQRPAPQRASADGAPGSDREHVRRAPAAAVERVRGGRPRAARDRPRSKRHADPAQRLVQDAYRELGKGRARAAQALAARALQLDPTRARTYIVLGGARDALGDRAGARAAFRACVRSATDPLVSACKTLAR